MSSLLLSSVTGCSLDSKTVPYKEELEIFWCWLLVR